ncbi:hypothetical protein GQ473_00285 [archaeon]|nr:hypothetical protein [archaeon]
MKCKKIDCDECGINITDRVYYAQGYTYNCCSHGCLARIMLNVQVSTIQARFDYLNED